jgi:hypothetical protein
MKINVTKPNNRACLPAPPRTHCQIVAFVKSVNNLMPSSNSEASSTPNPEDSGPVRRRGRPKGSKNGPNAGSVGRPRKDGQPPKKRNGTMILL